MKLFKSQTVAIGLAMFSMFFGAGNIIFPLALGQYAGDKNFWAILGLILTAAVIPILGVIAMILYEGNYKAFFGRIGKIPGLLLALLTISLLGPFGSTPRCIALSYTTLKSSFPNLHYLYFSGISCLVIFLFSYRKKSILDLLGWILTPALLVSLGVIIALGLLTPHEVEAVDHTKWSVFVHGLKEGYNTMDLLASFFFSSTILSFLKLKKEEEGRHLKTAFKASLLGALLLALTYIGFSYLASFHGKNLVIQSKDELLAAITMKIAGSMAGVLVCITIALACLTTAIALITAFADFIQKEIFKDKFSYEAVLCGSLILTFLISTYEFTGISAFLSPVLEICYPGLILFTVLNIFHRLRQFRPIKAPVFFSFALTSIYYFIAH